MSDPVREWALRAVGRTRALGMHFYGHFIGVSGEVLERGRVRLRLEGEPPGVGAAAVSPVAFAAVADLALGSAIRTWLEPGARLGTMTLSIQHPTVGVSGPLVAEATAAPVEKGQGAAHCSVSGPDGSVVGWGHGRFAALPAPPGVALPLTPWERDRTPEVVVPAEGELDDREAAAVAAAVAAGERAAARGTAVSQELLAFEWEARPEGRASGALPIGPELGNRVGHVQGGILYGAAAAAAMQSLGVPDAALADGYYQFLRPADGAMLLAEATVLRRGRSAAFVEARLAVDETPVGAGLFAFRL